MTYVLLPHHQISYTGTAYDVCSGTKTQKTPTMAEQEGPQYLPSQGLGKP